MRFLDFNGFICVNDIIITVIESGLFNIRIVDVAHIFNNCLTKHFDPSLVSLHLVILWHSLSDSVL